MGRTVGRPERHELAPGLEISRVVTGLWQVADMERDGGAARPATRGADALADYAAAGFDTFDMADHYGSAEMIAGRLLVRHGGADRAAADGVHQMVPDARADDAGGRARRRSARSLDRLGVERIDLLQFHWWTVRASGLSRRDARAGGAAATRA